MTRALRCTRFAQIGVPNVETWVAADNFNRADSSSAFGTPYLGSAWTEHSGGWGISSNAGYVYFGAGDNIASVPVTTGSRGRVHARVKASSDACGILCRVTDANNWILFGFAASNDLYMYRRQAGAYTLINTKAYTRTAGNFYTLDLYYNGSSLVGYVNGALELTGTDGAFTGVARAGLRTFGANNGRFDDFAAT